VLLLLKGAVVFEKIYKGFITRQYLFSVLDGKLAVSCNLKSAYAGSNIAGRALLNLMLVISGVEAFSSTQWISFKPRQIRKEAAVEPYFMCRRFLGLSWLLLSSLDQRVQPAMHRIIHNQQFSYYNSIWKK